MGSCCGTDKLKTGNDKDMKDILREFGIPPSVRDRSAVDGRGRGCEAILGLRKRFGNSS